MSMVLLGTNLILDTYMIIQLTKLQVVVRLLSTGSEIFFFFHTHPVLQLHKLFQFVCN